MSYVGNPYIPRTNGKRRMVNLTNFSAENLLIRIPSGAILKALLERTFYWKEHLEDG